MRKITAILENGESKELNLVLAFENKETNKKYIIYSIDDNSKLLSSVFTINENEEMVLEELSDSSELEYVQQIISSLANKE